MHHLRVAGGAGVIGGGGSTHGTAFRPTRDDDQKSMVFRVFLSKVENAPKTCTKGVTPKKSGPKKFPPPAQNFGSPAKKPETPCTFI